MPAAVVVQMVIEPQRHLLSSGLALLPPMVTFPNGEKNTTTQVTTMKNAPAENNQPKVSSIQPLIAVVTVKKLSRLTKLASTAVMSIKKGGIKTLYRN